jgi:hypothetical protein
MLHPSGWWVDGMSLLVASRSPSTTCRAAATTHADQDPSLRPDALPPLQLTRRHHEPSSQAVIIERPQQNANRRPAATRQGAKSSTTKRKTTSPEPTSFLKPFERKRGNRT